MFESPKSRKEFIAALRGGKISPQVLGRAMDNPAVFNDLSFEEISWTLTQNVKQIQDFGSAVLGHIQDPDKGGKLMTMLEQETRPPVQAALAAAIGACGGDGLGGHLAKMVNNKNVAVRQKALTLLLGLPDWHTHRNLVLALAGDPKPEVSEAITREIIAKAPRHYAGFLRQTADHQNNEIRGACLQALIAMNQIKNADILIRRLGFEQGEIQKQVYGAIGNFIKQDPETMVERVVSALAATEPEVRQTAMTLLLKLPDQQGSFRKLLRFSESLSSFLRDQVFTEMAKHADTFAELVLATFKTEKDPALRLQLMNLAKILKHQRLAPIFLHEMKNPDWMVRYAAMQVLGDMKSQQAIPVLAEALNHPESSMAAIQALDKFRDIRLAKPLFAKLPKGNESEQTEILKALQNIGDARLLPHMAKFLDSAAPKGKVKKLCAETIIAMCKATGTKVPARVHEIHDSLREKSVDDLPDLGLKLSLD